MPDIQPMTQPMKPMPPMQIDDAQMQMEPMTMRWQHGDAHGEPLRMEQHLSRAND